MISQPDQPKLESDRPPVVSEARILTPAIIVLLGSTSTLAALELMRHMLTLRPSDRRRVAFVYIDTDDPPSTLIEFRRQHNGVFQEFPLRIAVPAGISHVERIAQRPVRERLRAFSEQHTFIQDREPQYFANGAGGIRNNGHVAACFNYDHIYDALDRALVTVSRVGTEQGEVRVRDVQVNIVAFLGGGTGSGILSDIAVMIRDLLTNYLYQQRINLFCMLPEPIRGASLTDLSWRKSNATACLLELLAFSGAAVGDPTGKYSKWMRDKVHRLTSDPLANEVYLVGHASMDDATNTARIVGLDLFQRITDASGVGFLERSKWMDRRTLGETDDRGMPTMFGTSCPLEVRFPAEETALAFAHIAAANLLPLLASYQPSSVSVNEADKREWMRRWREVARFDANSSDPRSVKIGAFGRNEFENADQARLDLFWSRLERFERETEKRIKEVIALKQKEEVKRINEMPQQDASDSDTTSLLNRRIQYLSRLQEEYRVALDKLLESDRPRIPQRPFALEANLTQPGTFLSRLRMGNRDHASDVYAAYNRRLRIHAEVRRSQLLEQLLEDLIQTVREALKFSLSWFENTEVDERAQEFEEMGVTSMAWQGRLEYPHPHQRHIFDLRTLRTQDGRSIAAERLYRWATGGDIAVDEGIPIDYSSFIGKCVDYLSRHTTIYGSNAKQASNRLEEQNAGRLADRVVDFFHEYYVQKFEDTNLFELLDKAAPPSQKGQSRIKQISGYLLEHLQHIRGLMSSLIAFEAELWHKGQTTLDTSIYLGIHWRDGHQKGILDQTLDILGPVTSRGQVPMINPAIDPHRLQVVYGQHAISLSTVRDFYLDQNSAMEAYLSHQKQWEDSGGSKLYGLMPVHSSGEAQWLVRDEKALGYMNPLYKRVIREMFLTSTPSLSGKAAPDETDKF